MEEKEADTETGRQRQPQCQPLQRQITASPQEGVEAEAPERDGGSTVGEEL